MRREYDVREIEQRGTERWLPGKDIERSRRDLAALEGIDEGVLVDDVAT